MNLLSVLLLLGIVCGPVLGQGNEESYQVYGEHPRLLLNQRRLRLLDRERQRESIRWIQLESLIAGGANMPEKGFAYALYYRSGGDKAVGNRAVEWAVGPATDVRQIALVFDWCQPLLSEQQSGALVAKLRRALDPVKRPADLPAIRDRVFAAIALANHVPDLPQSELRHVIETWWRKNTAPLLQNGRSMFPREHSYALLEVLHAFNDNLNIDLRESAPDFFKNLASFLVLSYYPASYPASENEYRIPHYSGQGEPDLNTAALSRAADLSLVALDTNATESQFLQGWLIQDRFLMRGTFGIPYEFLWANPYQPGLSYYHLPNLFHDRRHSGGRLLVRSSWDDDATWYGFLDGKAQLFQDGRISTPGTDLRVGEVQIISAKSPFQFRVTKDSPENYFLIGLKPGKAYELEVDDEEMREVYSDSGGILNLTFSPGTTAGVHLRESR
jgi:hypothetical protein